MPTPRPVSKRLREMLGAEAAETMVDWLDGLETHREEGRRELREEMSALRVELRGEMGQLRGEMGRLRGDMGELRQEMAELRGEMRAGFAEIRQEMRVGFAAVETKSSQRNADLTKWMIGFWLASFVGMISAILALGRIGR